MGKKKQPEHIEGQQGLGMDEETRKINRLVDIQLQPAELGALGVDAGRLSGELSAAEKAKKAVVDEQTAIVKKIDAELQAVLDKLQKRTETREVECLEKRCYSTNTLTVHHGDELIEERAMTIEERQMTFGEPKNGVVMDAEEEDGTEFSEEDRKRDLEDVMRAERNAGKPSIVDLRPLPEIGLGREDASDDGQK